MSCASPRKGSKTTRRRRKPSEETRSSGKRLARQLGQRIRELRKRRGVTLVRLAEMTNLSQSGLSYIENGVKGVKSETLLRIAAILDVAPIEFFDFPENVDTEATVSTGRAAEKKRLDAALRSWEFAKVAKSLARLHLTRPRVFRRFIDAMDGLLERESGGPGRGRRRYG